MSRKTFKLKLSQAIQGFFLAQHSRHLSLHTIADYDNTLRKFRAFLEKDYNLEDITPQHIESFLAGQTSLSNKTLLNYYTGLSALWTWAIRQKIVVQHVPHEVEAPKPEQRDIVPYTEAEIRLMLNSLERTKRFTRPGKKISDRATRYPERSRAIILLLLDTGLRAQELCNIKIHQVDNRNQRIKVFGKGAKERFVRFSPRTHQALWRYLTTRESTDGDEPLFTIENDRPIKRRRLNRIIVNIAQRAGVPDANVHRFRYTFAIQYLRNRGDPYTLQTLLGHSDLAMVKRYLAITQSDVEAAHRLASPVDNWAL